MERGFWKKVAPMHEVGAAVTRVDALDKVKGTAKYTDDLCPKPCLVARLVHAQIANGWVREIDTTEAEAIPGVVAVFTYKDVPEHRFPTPGHPWSVEPAHQDVADRRLLDDRVRIYGDDIAVVVAEDNVAADRGVRAVLAHTTHEELPVMTTVEQALAPDAPVLHPEVRETNVLAHSDMVTPLEGTGCDSVEAALADPKYHTYEAHTETQQADVLFGDASIVDAGARRALSETGFGMAIAQPNDAGGAYDQVIAGSIVTDNAMMMRNAFRDIESGSFGNKTVAGDASTGGISVGTLSDVLVEPYVHERYLGIAEQIAQGTFIG